MKNSFKISEVARFLSITTTTLRHYEKEGLIKPYYTDEITNYRYYNLDNINDISYIVLLRKVGISINQIKEYLTNNTGLNEVLNDLINQRDLLNNTIQQIESISISNYNYIVNEITLSKCSYISKSYNIKGIDDAYSKVQLFLSEVLNHVNVELPLIYLEVNYNEVNFNNLNTNIGIEISKSNIEHSIRDETLALETYHKGTYETITNAHEEIKKYALDNNLKLKGNIYHYFYESFSLRKDSNSFLTKIIMPIY
ncbi:MAG: MerR family transcriptional regulator [bacterium]